MFILASINEDGADMKTDIQSCNRSLPVLAVLVMLMLASACSMLPGQPPDAAAGDILYVYDDGSMKLNDRYIDPDNVVIYPDGFGGERAALKMRVPLHPDYYRDTIIVERETDSDAAVVD